MKLTLTVAATILASIFAAVATLAQQQPTTPAGDSGVDIVASLKQLKNRDKLVLKYDKFKDYTVEHVSRLIFSLPENIWQLASRKAWAAGHTDVDRRLPFRPGSN